MGNKFKEFFSKATKILIQPSFGFTAKAWKTSHSRKTMTPEAAKLLNDKRKAGLIPPSNSERKSFGE